MAFEQRISYVTLGVRDMPILRAFYAELGWKERPGSSDDFATYEARRVILALYPLGHLGQEAAPRGTDAWEAWNGITLGIILESTEAVDETFRSGSGGRRPGRCRSGQACLGGYSG